jgi:hypothetical protein
MKVRHRQKLFCIGFNKTGTTSLACALAMLGLRVGDQNRAELLIDDWARRDFRRLIAYCRTADAFQDVPFSLAHTYAVLDHAFPGSKFVHTERNSGDEWFDSLTRFHMKLLGKRQLPTPAEMRDFEYLEAGWFWRAHQLVYGVNESNLYDRRHYVAQYELHNRQVKDYFRHRRNDLLILNVGQRNAMAALCRFLEVDHGGRQMPHLNSSRRAA